MAIPSTSTVTPLFITAAPAWERGIKLEQMMSSDLTTSRSGLEQRQKKNSRSRWKIEYRTFLNASERDARMIRSRAEIVSPLFLPFWTEAGITATPIALNRVSIDRAATTDFFAPGDWVYFTSATQGSQFRQIDGAGLTDQELILFPDVSGIAFSPLTRIYPCRAVVRQNGQAEFEEESSATMLERLTYTTL